MAALTTYRPWTTQTVRLSSVLRPLAVTAGILAAAAALPALAHADPSNTPVNPMFGGAGAGNSMFGGAGTGNNMFGGAGAGNNGGSLTDKIAGIGQSICPSLVKPGASLASITSKLSGNGGLPPDMVGMVASMAIQMECPGVMTSLAHGQMPNMPFPMQGLGGIGGNPGASPFQLPGAGPMPSLPGASPVSNPLMGLGH